MTFQRGAVAGVLVLLATAVCFQLSVERWELTGLLLLAAPIGLGLVLSRRQTRAVLRAQRMMARSGTTNERLVRQLRCDQRTAIRGIRSDIATVQRLAREDIAAVQRLALESSRQQAEDCCALSEQIADLNAKLMQLCTNVARLGSTPHFWVGDEGPNGAQALPGQSTADADVHAGGRYQARPV